MPKPDSGSNSAVSRRDVLRAGMVGAGTWAAAQRGGSESGGGGRWVRAHATISGVAAAGSRGSIWVT